MVKTHNIIVKHKKAKSKSFDRPGTRPQTLEIFALAEMLKWREKSLWPPDRRRAARKAGKAGLGWTNRCT
jgi:hypothetical protein